MQLYEIVRFYSPDEQAQGKQDYVVKQDLTLKEAQAHCQDPTTHEFGKWFDGYRRQ